MKTTTFWTAFLLNEPFLRDALDTDMAFRDQTPFNEFWAELLDYCPHFSFEMTSKKGIRDGQYRLTLSCNGNRDYFIDLNRLVDTAPKISQWKIKSFLEPKGSLEVMLDQPFVFSECTIIPNTISFQILAWDSEQGIFDLQVVLPLHLRGVEDEKLRELLYIVFQDIWGEKFVGRRINTIIYDFKQESGDEFFDLYFLQEFLDGFEEYTNLHDVTEPP